MAMRELVRGLGLRLPSLAQHSICATGAGATAGSVMLGTQKSMHAGRLTNPWEEVLRVAKSNPEKLHEIVDTLTNHCIRAQTAPPLDTYNEMLRICDMHSDVASVHKLCQMACAVRMHLDHTTFERLQAAYSYFPKPYATHLTGVATARAEGPCTPPAAAATGHTSSSMGPANGSSSGSAPAVSQSSSIPGVRPGAIREAPATSSVPSISTTGGATSVSVGSSSSSSSSSNSAAGIYTGMKFTHTTQTNVWLPPAGTPGTGQQTHQQAVSGRDSSTGGCANGTVPSLEAPDASA